MGGLDVGLQRHGLAVGQASGHAVPGLELAGGHDLAEGEGNVGLVLAQVAQAHLGQRAVRRQRHAQRQRRHAQQGQRGQQAPGG